MNRRGTILLAVLIITVLGALTGSTMLYLARAERAGLSVSIDGVQSRALAWSAIQVVASELVEQRDRLLSGEEPELETSWTLWDDGNNRGIARIIPRGELSYLPESGKLDINHADEEMLAALELLGPDAAREIVTRRESEPFMSIEELMSLDSISESMLFGEPEDNEGGGLPAPLTLLDLLTVFSFEPNVQAGIGDDGTQHRGERRINLNQPWSDELHRPLERRYGREVADLVQGLMKDGTRFDDDRSIIRILNRFRVEPSEWSETLDVLTTEARPYRNGRIDVNTAPLEVLALLPHITESIADSIVETRPLLSDEERMSPSWIAAYELVSPREFEDIIDHITFRTLQWRFRVEAGIERQDADEIGLSRTGDLDEVELEDAVTFDVVIDLASPRPRIAYLRDVTHLGLSETLRSLATDDRDTERGAGDAIDDILITDRAVDADADRAEFMSQAWSRDDWSRDEFSRESWGREEWGREEWSLEEERSPTTAQRRREVIEDSDADTRIGRWTNGRQAQDLTSGGDS